MFPVSNIIFYLNRSNKLDNSDFYNSLKHFLTLEINNLFVKSKVYEGIRLTYYCPQKSEVGVIVFLRFFGIYQTELNYRIIYDVINKIVNSYKNKIITVTSKEYTSLISVKYFDVIKIKEILLHLEKYYSKILEETRDKLYDINVDIEQIINNASKNIKENEFFLKCHRTTKFHDIDIKLWETRQALACGLSLTAIVMLGVTLEECLKTILKNNYEQEIRKTQEGANLSLLAEASLKAEEKYGNLQLYNLIVALHNEKFIDEEERKHLLHIKDYIRNASIHSDKSKIFDINTKGSVTALKLENNKIEYVETQELSMLQMSFAQGIMQKRLADENAKIIFYEIEEYIYKISKRFWDKWK